MTRAREAWALLSLAARLLLVALLYAVAAVPLVALALLAAHLLGWL